jgi:hypothetical protein
VKVARIAPRAAAGLPVSTLHDGDDVDARVRRLVASGERASPGGGNGRAWMWMAGAAIAAGVAASTFGLAVVHRLMEMVVRLLS